MPININATNYINNQVTGNSQNVPSSVNVSATDDVVVSARGLDLKSGQTISGQVIEINGKDIKLLLSNDQTINARLEGNINALLGQTLSFEVKNSENGQTALRPLYTNLNTSQTVSNALQSAGFPVTENYAKMVSTMMDEGMPINKAAISDMSKDINSFPTANPETIVKLNKLGLQINELTINQYENYKGLEHQIKNDVDTISKGLADLVKESLQETVSNNDIEEITLLKQPASFSDTALASAEAVKTTGKNLLNAFINAITGSENSNNAVDSNINALNESAELENIVNENETNSELNKPTIDTSVFDTSRIIMDMVEPSDSQDVVISSDMKTFAEEFTKELEKNNLVDIDKENVENNKIVRSGREELLNELTKSEVISGNKNTLFDKDIPIADYSGKQILQLAKNILNEMQNNPEKFPEAVKEKLTKLLASKEFGGLIKDNLTKQMLLKPEEVVNSKNVEDLYSKIVKQANQAVEILNAAGKDDPNVLNAAKSINDNVNFMNELNQVATYVQLPLLMNNKAAHGDLYVYTKKKSLKDNDGNISALLHLDMENLGPMDIYVQLTDKTKLNTNFYLRDEATIDFIEMHIDQLNKRLTQKGYNMNVNMSVKDTAKGPTNMADEFMKSDPHEEGIVASKFSFDVRA